MMTKVKNVTVNFLKTLVFILALLVAKLSVFSVQLFNNIVPKIFSKVEKESLSSSSKKNYTMKNLLVFGLTSFTINEVLNSTKLEILIFYFILIFLVLSIYIYISITNKIINFKNLVTCFNIFLKLGILLKLFQIIVFSLYNIPVIGSLFLGYVLLTHFTPIIKEIKNTID